MSRRSKLIRTAAELPKGDPKRREILARIAAPVPKYDKRKYLKGLGMHCPFCGHESYPQSQHPKSADEVYQPIHCKNCGSEWDDIYKLDDIEIKKGPQVAADKLKYPAEKGYPLAEVSK